MVWCGVVCVWWGVCVWGGGREKKWGHAFVSYRFRVRFRCTPSAVDYSPLCGAEHRIVSERSEWTPLPAGGWD